MRKGIYHEREGKMRQEDSGWMGEDLYHPSICDEIYEIAKVASKI